MRTQSFAEVKRTVRKRGIRMRKLILSYESNYTTRCSILSERDFASEILESSAARSLTRSATNLLQGREENDINKAR